MNFVKRVFKNKKSTEDIWNSIIEDNTNLNIKDVLKDGRFSAEIYNLEVIKTEQLLDRCISIKDIAFLYYKVYSFYRTNPGATREISVKMVQKKMEEFFNKKAHTLDIETCSHIHELLNSVVDISEDELFLLRVKNSGSS